MEKTKKAKKILIVVNTALEELGSDVSIYDLLSKADVSEQAYIDSLKVGSRGKTVILKRNPSDVLTNGCNINILKLWKGNIDFQFVVDEYSTVMYVCGYMMKSEKALGEQLKRVAKECQSEHISDQLKKIGSIFLGSRVVGTPEAVMRLNSMWLIKKSRKVTFVSTNEKKDRPSIPKPKEKLKNLDNDDEDIFMTSIHDRYAARPNSKETLCLAKFAVTYEAAANDNKSSGGENILSDEGVEHENIGHNKNRKKQEIIRLQNNLGFMRKRKRESVLRTHRFKLTGDSEKYYHSLLMLYFPWHSEEEIRGPFVTYEEHYRNVKNIVDENSQHFELNSGHIDNAFDALVENGPPETSWESVVPSIEEDNMNTLNDGYHIRQCENEDDSVASQKITSDNQNRNKLSMQYTMEAQKDIMSSHEYRDNVRNLNSGQRKIIMYNRAWCKAAVIALKKGQMLNGYHIFLSGPGGTGKSHVINLIRRDIIHSLNLQDKLNLMIHLFS